MSEENANPSTQRKELNDNNNERGKVEQGDSELFVGIAENKRNFGKNDNFAVKLWRLWIKGYK